MENTRAMWFRSCIFRVKLSEIGYAAAAFGISHDEVRQVAYGRLGGR